MEQHKRVLGIIYIITSAIQILGLLLLSLFFSTLLAFIGNRASGDDAQVVEFVFGIIRIVSWALVLFNALPSLIAGFGLMNSQRWAVTLALILGCFKLLAFPIGTAIGVYSIWVYAETSKLENTKN